MSVQDVHPRQILDRLRGSEHRKKLVAERVFRELRQSSIRDDADNALGPKLSPNLR